VYKSKYLMAALLPFLFLRGAFAADVRDAKSDNRRMSGLTFVGKHGSKSPKTANQKATNQTAKTNSVNLNKK